MHRVEENSIKEYVQKHCITAFKQSLLTPFQLAVVLRAEHTGDRKTAIVVLPFALNHEQSQSWLRPVVWTAALPTHNKPFSYSFSQMGILQQYQAITYTCDVWTRVRPCTVDLHVPPAFQHHDSGVVLSHRMMSTWVNFAVDSVGFYIFTLNYYFKRQHNAEGKIMWCVGAGSRDFSQKFGSIPFLTDGVAKKHPTFLSEIRIVGNTLMPKVFPQSKHQHYCKTRQPYSKILSFSSGRRKQIGKPEKDRGEEINLTPTEETIKLPRKRSWRSRREVWEWAPSHSGDSSLTPSAAAVGNFKARCVQVPLERKQWILANFLSHFL